ncbi:glycosyltransferase 87 family protein [uncultured Propionibacterium sp.]|uniref:glycosyltransferase 87 family protein n=1 Tax=uncultured Propionibacterium sp. TaxID=218066 RepID=UPI00292D3875|nr:glycosyltransferase 87 family protein [uncultured Propionibacterium sp.]
MSRKSPYREEPLSPDDGPIWLALFWALSRVVMLCLWQALCSYIRNDVNYYALSVAGHPVPVLSDLTDVLGEYPTPLVWLIQLLEAPSGGSVDLYVLLFALTTAIVDGACCMALYRRESVRAAWVWAICGALLGPLLWFRLDIAPALCVLGALHQMRRRPALAGALLALGAGFKLWPALLILPALGRGRAARRRGAGFAITGAALALLSLVTSGFGRTVSPLSWQSERGLQIESIWATPLMVARGLGATGVSVSFSRFKAYEVFASSVDGWITAAGISMIVLIVLTLVLSSMIVLRPGHRGPGRGADPLDDAERREWAVQLAVLAITAGWIVVNKALSPQYMVWLFGPLAIISSNLTRPGRTAAARRLVAVGLVSVALTQLVYPLTYNGIIAAADPSIGSTMILVLRNLSVIGLTVMAWAEAFRAARRPRSRGSRSSRGGGRPAVATSPQGGLSRPSRRPDRKVQLHDSQLHIRYDPVEGPR